MEHLDVQLETTKNTQLEITKINQSLNSNNSNDINDTNDTNDTNSNFVTAKNAGIKFDNIKSDNTNTNTNTKNKNNTNKNNNTKNEIIPSNSRYLSTNNLPTDLDNAPNPNSYDKDFSTSSTQKR